VFTHAVRLLSAQTENRATFPACSLARQKHRLREPRTAGSIPATLTPCGARSLVRTPALQADEGEFDPLAPHRANVAQRGRGTRLKTGTSEGSNPSARTNANVAQSAGGSGFKPRAVEVRILSLAPRAMTGWSPWAL
jgi:hypothetical protein